MASECMTPFAVVAAGERQQTTMRRTEPSREPGSTGTSVLIVDDEELFARAVGKKLDRNGIGCELALDLAAARASLAGRPPDLILLDMRLPDGSGLDFLRELRAGDHADVPVLVLTAFGGLENAVAAMRERADDYLVKPVDLDALMVKIERVLGQADLSRRLDYSREREQRPRQDVSLVGTSAAMTALRSRIARIRRLAGQAGGFPPTVLIQGETGTGKDLVARTLHLGSDRARKPFVHLDCAALPKDLIEAELFGHEKGAFTHAHTARTGLVEAAEDGTVYLDEIGELPPDLQSRLLAVLERREVRRIGSTRPRPVAAWFIAATNRDLDEMVATGAFRSDLYFRLKVLSLHIPPLRERLDDLAPLLEHIAALTARRYGMPVPVFPPDVIEAARRHGWPGNVRELAHMVERAILLGADHGLEAPALGLAPASPAPADAGEGLIGLTLEEAERRLIVNALQEAGGNVSESARRLGVSRMALRYRIRKLGLDRLGRVDAPAGSGAGRREPPPPRSAL